MNFSADVSAAEEEVPRPVLRHRRTIGDRLRDRLAEALTGWTGTEGWDLHLTRERDWAGATLEGVRVTLRLDCRDPEHAPAMLSASLIERLETLEFSFPRHIVGDLHAVPNASGLLIEALMLKQD